MVYKPVFQPWFKELVGSMVVVWDPWDIATYILTFLGSCFARHGIWRWYGSQSLMHPAWSSLSFPKPPASLTLHWPHPYTLKVAFIFLSPASFLPTTTPIPTSSIPLPVTHLHNQLKGNFIIVKASLSKTIMLWIAFRMKWSTLAL